MKKDKLAIKLVSVSQLQYLQEVTDEEGNVYHRISQMENGKNIVWIRLEGVKSTMAHNSDDLEESYKRFLCKLRGLDVEDSK